jgi:autotransporter-associated beta strand protein
VYPGGFLSGVNGAVPVRNLFERLWARKSLLTARRAKIVRRPIVNRPRLETLEDRLAPAVVIHDWTGLGANNLWSNTQNWTNGAPGSEAPGDTAALVFHTNTAQLSSVDDVANLSVDSITFDANAASVAGVQFANGGTTTTGYSFSGNQSLSINTAAGISIAGNLTASPNSITESFGSSIAFHLKSNTAFTVNDPRVVLTIGGTVDLANHTLTVTNTNTSGQDDPTLTNSGVNLNGAVSGVGGKLDKEGVGTLTLAVANSYTGGTTVNSGVVALLNNSSLGSAAGVTTVNEDGGSSPAGRSSWKTASPSRRLSST